MSRLWRSIRSLQWRRNYKMLSLVLVSFVVLYVVFGDARVTAITSSERHAVDDLVTVDIQGSDAIFDDGFVHEINVSFNQADYDRMIASFQEDGRKEYIEASITIDGTTIGSVGLRLKGNSTLASLSGEFGGGGLSANLDTDNPASLPWLISLDKFIEGQRYQGYSEIAIRPVSGSTTMLNEAVALSLVDMAGEPSQQSSYTSFSVNGDQATLRLLVEVPQQTWVDRVLDGDGVLYKALSSGSFRYLGDDPTAYEDAFEQITRNNQQDLAPLINLLKWVEQASDEEFERDLANYVDVESLATYIAIQEQISNSDDMSGPGQNYYLWYDLDTGTFTVITWDLNLALGQGFGGPGGGGFGGQNGMFPGGELPEGQFEIPDGFTPPDGQQEGEFQVPEGFTPPEGQQEEGQFQMPGGFNRPGGQQGGQFQMPDGFTPPEGQEDGDFQPPAGVPDFGNGQTRPDVGGGGRGGAGGGGFGGNQLKERFQSSDAFDDVRAAASANVYAALYESGQALAELERIGEVLATSDLIDAATLESEIASIRTQLESLAARYSTVAQDPGQ